jgi:hypothetical protein
MYAWKYIFLCIGFDPDDQNEISGYETPDSFI